MAVELMLDPGLELPQGSAGLLVERHELARQLAGEDEAAAGGQHPGGTRQVGERHRPLLLPVSGSTATKWPYGSPGGMGGRRPVTPVVFPPVTCGCGGASFWMRGVFHVLA